MKTYVTEVDGEAVIAFRALDDHAAETQLDEQEGILQAILRGWGDERRSDTAKPLWDGVSELAARRATPKEHATWLKIRSSPEAFSDLEPPIAYGFFADDPDEEFAVFLIPVFIQEETYH